MAKDNKKETKCGIINFDNKTYCDLVRGHKDAHNAVPLSFIASVQKGKS